MCRLTKLLLSITSRSGLYNNAHRSSRIRNEHHGSPGSADTHGTGCDEDIIRHTGHNGYVSADPPMEPTR
eukprot:25064-Eustigmatos_ZCMA.PRE.1